MVGPKQAAQSAPATQPASAAQNPARFAQLPTPLSAAPRLANSLGISGTLLLKRDDLTGFAVAGNKARTLEPLIADALATDSTTIVTGGTAGSNFCQGAAAAAAWAGLDCVLVLAGTATHHPNLTAARQWGAHVVWTSDPNRHTVDTAIERTAQELREAGERPYLCPRGGANPLGATGFYYAAFELSEQLSDQGVNGPVQIVLGTGSGGTLAGLIAGNIALERPWRITGTAVSRPLDETAERVCAFAQGVADMVGTSPPEPGDIDLVDARGAGHGIGTPDEARFATTALRSTGIVLDPVYTAKALAALPGVLGGRANDSTLTTIFWHTGGLLDAVAGWEHN